MRHVLVLVGWLLVTAVACETGSDVVPGASNSGSGASHSVDGTSGAPGTISDPPCDWGLSVYNSPSPTAASTEDGGSCASQFSVSWCTCTTFYESHWTTSYELCDITCSCSNNLTRCVSRAGDVQMFSGLCRGCLPDGGVDPSIIDGGSGNGGSRGGAEAGSASPGGGADSGNRTGADGSSADAGSE